MQPRNPSRSALPMSPRCVVFQERLLPYSETFILEQVKAYRRWNPLLVGISRVEGLSLEGVPWRCIEQRPPNRLSSWSRKLLTYAGVPLRSDIEFLRTLAPHLVHAHFATTAVRIWPTVRALRIPFVVTLHGADIHVSDAYYRSGRAGWVQTRFPERLRAMATDPATRFIAVSESIRRAGIRRGIPAERIEVCHIGVDVETFTMAQTPPSRRPRIILFVGRLVEKKGCEYLIRAFAGIRRSVPATRLVVIGDGPLRAELEKLSTSLGTQVTFTGALPADDVTGWLRESRVLVLPSVVAGNGDAEGFGMVLLEAQASGVPVITSADGGAEEAVRDGLSGYAFPQKDVDALSHRLRMVLLDDDLADRMSIAGRYWVESRFDIKRCSADLESLYDRTLSAHSGQERPCL